MKTTAPDPLLLELTKSLRFSKNYDPVTESTDLDAIEKLVLAEVLHYRVSGRPFYMSMGKLCIRAGTKRSTLKKRMRDMERRGYIHVTVNRRNFNQANVVEVGPATYALLQGRGVMRSREEVETSSAEADLPINASEPLRTSVAQERATNGHPPTKRSKRPTWQVNKVVSSAEEKLPVDLFKMLDYNPSKGKELTAADAVKVFAWHGLPNEKAWEWWDARIRAGWPPTFDRLELCREKAAKLAAEQETSAKPPHDLFERTSEDEPPPFDDDPTDWEPPPFDDDPLEHINV